MPAEQILLVEDDEAMRNSCRQALQDGGYTVHPAASPGEAEPVLLREPIALVVTDLRMPGGGGRRMLQVVKAAFPDLPVILITAYPSVETAIEAFKGGVVDYLLKPFTGDQLLEAVGRALGTRRARDCAEILRRAGRPDPGLPGMLGRSPRFHALLTDIRRAAPLEGHVLIQGETGTGKELVARAIHGFSRRSARPFVAMNCAAIPEALLESEMFGFEKGAFTGAAAEKAGLLELAGGGSLLLDEIGDLAPSAQAKLLRALEEKTCRRVGGVVQRPVDVRILAATHKDLQGEVQAGRFRQDVFYRLSALEIRVPPLREHPEDIPLLAIAFLDRLASGRPECPVAGFSEEALELLAGQPWPGNVRELQNAAQKAFALAGGPLITPEDLRAAGVLRPSGCGEAASPRRMALADFEREYLMDALRAQGGNVTRTAEALGIHRTTLQRLIRKHGIEPAAAANPLH